MNEGGTGDEGRTGDEGPAAASGGELDEELAYVEGADPLYAGLVSSS